MPFPEGTPAQLRAAYPAIQRAVAQRASTAEVWNAVRPYLTNLTPQERWAASGQISRLRGLAAAERNAEEHFAKSPNTQSIEARHIGLPAWARGDAERVAAPHFVARVQLIQPAISLEGPGGAESQAFEEWRTLHLGDQPLTVGEVRTAVEQAVAEGSTGRGAFEGSPTGADAVIGRIQLLAT